MSGDLTKKINQPFKNLATLLERKRITLTPQPKKLRRPSPPPSCASAKNESEMFLEAMQDVKPIKFNRIETKNPTCFRSDGFGLDKDNQETLEALRKLIQHGHGFIVSQTPEYMESAFPGTHNELLRQLHQGRFAIQDYVDLHGLRVAEAESVLKKFILDSIVNGLRTILVVHGRGLTSPHQPVLKHKVFSWLSQGPLRKWVIAMTSARTCDGGAGATYVLLRCQPMTKSRRKKMARSAHPD